jgi:hypothetical protein
MHQVVARLQMCVVQRALLATDGVSSIDKFYDQVDLTSTLKPNNTLMLSK